MSGCRPEHIAVKYNSVKKGGIIYGYSNQMAYAQVNADEMQAGILAAHGTAHHRSSEKGRQCHPRIRKGEISYERFFYIPV